MQRAEAGPRSAIEKNRGVAKIVAMNSRTALMAFLLSVAVILPARADFIGHGGMVRSVDVSPDGSRVITGGFDYSARIWNFGDQSEIAMLDLHEGPVTSVRFGPKGQRALTTSDDHTAILWDTKTFQPIRRFQGHKHKVMASAFTRDGSLIATGSWDNTVRIWDPKSDNPVTVIRANAPVNAVAFLKGGTLLVSGGHHPVMQIWNTDDGSLAGKLEGHRMGITALSVSPDGKRLMSASIDKHIKIWDIETAQEIRSINVRDGQVYDADFSPDGTRALTAGKDGFIVEWDLRSGKPLHEIAAHQRIAWSAAYSPDGRFAISASSDEQARVWHLETGDRIGLTAEVGNEPKPWLESDHPGAKLYTKCAKCHALRADGPSRSGPHFEGLFGRRVGSVAGYRYSQALISAKFKWNDKTLFRLFHEGPDNMLPGTKMPVQKVTDDKQLAELVAYLRVLTSKSSE